MHDCFLVSDSRLKQKSHYGWSGSIQASDTRYDYYFWQNINQAMAVIGNKAYYMSQSFTGYWRTVHCFDLSTGTDTEVHTFFYGMGGYDRKYTPVWVWQDILYYPIRNELYAVPLSGGMPQCVFRTNWYTEWIFYMLGQGSTLNLYGAASAYVSGHKYSITMTTSYSLALDQEEIRLMAGDAAQLTAVLTPENPEAEILWSTGNENVAKVDFWAPWCMPCRMIAPVVEELAEEMEGKAYVGKVNVDEEGDLARAYRVNSIPCLIVFENGQEARRTVGAQGKDALKKLIEG